MHQTSKFPKKKIPAHKKIRQTVARWLVLGMMSMLLLGCEREAYVMSNPPILVAGDEFLDFGELPLGYTATRTLQMVNAGGQALTIDDYIALSDENVFMATFSKETIQVGGSVDVQIAFTPSEEQRYEGILRVKSNTGDGEEVTVELRGSGLSDVVCGDCESPPGDFCEDENTLVTYDRDGECAEDVCRFIKKRIDCPHGCETGVCLDAPEATDAGTATEDLTDAGRSAPEDAGVPVSSNSDAGLEEPAFDAGPQESEPPKILFYGFTQNSRMWESADINGMCWLADAPIFEIKSDNYQLNGVIELR
jgi:hypothetical protein